MHGSLTCHTFSGAAVAQSILMASSDASEGHARCFTMNLSRYHSVISAGIARGQDQQDGGGLVRPTVSCIYCRSRACLQ